MTRTLFKAMDAFQSHEGYATSVPCASVTAQGHARVLAIPRRAILEEFDRDSGFAARFYRALAVFLSDRLRSATSQDGGDELDEAVLDTLHQAGDRFIRLVALLDGREP